MISWSVSLLCLKAIFVASLIQCTLATDDKTVENKLEFTWDSLRHALGGRAVEGRKSIPLTAEKFSQFISNHPIEIFKNVEFGKLKELCSVEHDGEISVYDVTECYFTLSPVDLENLLKSYGDDKGELSHTNYMRVRDDTSIFDQSYEEIVRIVNKHYGATDTKIKVVFLTKHFYLQSPSRLIRLLRTVDHDNTTVIDKNKFDELETKYNVFKEDYDYVISNADKDKDGKLDFIHYVKYYFTKNQKTLMRLVLEYIDDQYSIDKNEYDKINAKYNLFNEDYEYVSKEADSNYNGKLSSAEFAHYYFKTSRKRMHRALKSFFKEGHVKIDEEKLQELQLHVNMFDYMVAIDAQDAVDINRDGKPLTVEELVAYYFTDSPKLLKVFLKDYDIDNNGSINEEEYNKMEKEYNLFNKSFGDVKNEVNKSNSELKVEEIVPYYFKLCFRQLVRAVSSFDKYLSDEFTEEMYNNMENELKLFGRKTFSDIKIIAHKLKISAADIATIYFTQDDAHIKSAIKSFAKGGTDELNIHQLTRMIDVFKIFINLNEAKPANFTEGKPIKVDDLFRHYEELRANPKTDRPTPKGSGATDKGTEGEHKFSNWKILSRALAGRPVDNQERIVLTEEMFSKFISKHPVQLFKDVQFGNLKELCSNDHEGDITVYDVTECYFTLSPNDLENFLRSFGEANGEFSKVQYNKIKNETSFFEEAYDEVVEIINKREDVTATKLKVDFLTKHYYLQTPSRLTRLIRTVDHERTGIIDKNKFDLLETKYKILKETYDHVLSNADKDTDGKLTVIHYLKYYFTKNQKTLLRLVLDYITDKYSIDKSEYDKIDAKFNIFNESFEDVLKEADTDYDGQLSSAELVHHYFRISRKRMHRAIKTVFKDGNVKFHQSKLGDLQLHMNMFDSMTLEDAEDAADINRDGRPVTVEELVAYYFTDSPKLLKIFFEDYDINNNGSINEEEYNKMEKEYDFFHKSFGDLKNEINKNNNELKIDEIIPYYFKLSIRQLIRAVKSFDKFGSDDFTEEKYNNMEKELKLFDGKTFTEVKNRIGNKKLTASDIVTIYFTQDDEHIKSAIKSFAKVDTDELDNRRIINMNQVFKIFKNLSEAKPAGHTEGKPIKVDELFTHYEELKEKSKQNTESKSQETPKNGEAHEAKSQSAGEEKKS